MTRCLAPDCRLGGLGCDNMTVVLICLLHGGTLAGLAVKCQRPAIVDEVRPLGSQLSAQDIPRGS